MARPGVRKQEVALSGARKRVKRNQFQMEMPDDVVEKIFSFIPIKKAVQLGTVSQSFKNSWAINRKLHFDREFARGRGRAQMIWIVNRIFRLHSGPKIDSFRLCFNHDGEECKAASWIKAAIQKEVEELDLDFRRGKHPFQISSDLVDFESIRVLKLSNCELHLPLKPTGLRFLNTLVLRKMRAPETLIRTVFTNCLLLGSLELLRCTKVFHLKIFAGKLRNFKELRVVECNDLASLDIKAPKLLSFHYHGYLSKLMFHGNPAHLKDVILRCPPPRSCLEMVRTQNLLLNLLHVTCLTVSSTFLEGLTQKYEEGDMREVPYYLANLKEFELIMDPTSFCNPYDISSFLKNCPRVENIFIDMNNFSFGSGYYWEFHAKKKFQEQTPPWKFDCLKGVKLKGFKFESPEMDLAKFFLEKAIILENLSLIAPKNNPIQFDLADAQVYNQCFVAWKTSPKAKIMLYRKDSSSISPKHVKTWA